MKTVLTIISILVCINGFNQESPVNHNTPAWYFESFIHSHHSGGQPAPEWEVQFERVRPDAVQFHGSAYSAGKELAKKYNFAMVTTVNRSGGWDDVRSIIEALPEEEQGLFYKRVNPDGSPATRFQREHLCYYSPGIDKYIVPEYQRITDVFRPAQIWIDHTIVTVNLCYCDVCKINFNSQYGTQPPEDAEDPYWDEWVKYHRKGFELWMEKIHNSAKSIDTNTLVTFNHAYFINQPEPPPAYVCNLSADIHSDPMNVCLFARYATTVGLPFEDRKSVV